ncbi:MAG: DEAD/DEAH box helicase family protein [candidate division WOR-3 bacterium]
MAKPLLQKIVEDFRFEDLPSSWNSFDIEKFSKNKKLWDYQQDAVKNAIKVLYKYYEDFVDYSETESNEVNQTRKERLWQLYLDNGLNEDIDIRLDRRKRNICNLLTDYYSPQNNKVSYQNFINRMCFWMATGSGKSLVIVKLIHNLIELIRRNEIPPCDILFLTHRDDLILQLRKHVVEFNTVNEPHIILHELKEYPEVKRHGDLFGIPVFYYRSDNLSDEQFEKIIDFKNYDNEGKWYIFLDEAHKGDREDSKRQHIYSIISRNGFLFNSSATFTDIRDIITCAYEFNLSSFINAGYGKHIAILKQEMRAFRDNEDYSGEEKQKIVLKSLIILTYVKKFYEKIKKVKDDLYHNPMMLTLVNSVNVEDADLKLFFRELERIGKGEITDDVFNTAIDELWQEIKEQPELMFEDGERIKFNESVFKGITPKDILKYVYNSKTFGAIEVSFRPSDRKQVAFKLATTNRHFALMKTGDMPNWLKNELSRFQVNHRFEEEGFFETLNREDSDINILMGSRAFYEGWDSNRPNVINYINIGIGEDARKFILQSIGRGVRIEPIKNKRKRALSLYNAKELDETIFNNIKNKVKTIETLFIFGTNRQALQEILTRLKEQKGTEITIGHLFTVNPNCQQLPLLIPVYKESAQPIYKKDIKTKFEINQDELALLESFINYLEDDRILLMRYNTDLEKLKVLKESLQNQDHFLVVTDKKYKNLDILLQRIFDYLGYIPKEFERLKELEKEIRHFENIKVELTDITDLQNKINMIKDFPRLKHELSNLYGKISPDEYTTRAQRLKDEETFETNNKRIKIKYIANHYYLPLIMSVDEKIAYIKHIITVGSERRFIEDLEKYLNDSKNKFNQFDWWMFSKIDASLDQVFIPYYNPKTNRIDSFYPDFIFWLKRDNDYIILFVDPKGTEHTAYLRKIDGYKELFEANGSEKQFSYNGYKVKVSAKIRPDDVAKVPQEYRKYAFDNVQDIL